MNLGLRYEYFGPQSKSDPKYDSNFYYGDPNLGEHERPAEYRRRTSRLDTRCPRTRARSARCGSPTGTIGRHASALRGTSTGTATSVRGGYGIRYERNFGNVTYNVLFNPPQYLVATIDAADGRPHAADLRGQSAVRSAASPA